jgi:hypothetical protein
MSVTEPGAMSAPPKNIKDSEEEVTDFLSHIPNV